MQEAIGSRVPPGRFGLAGLLAVMLLGMLVPARGVQELVWQIGRPDGDYREFAIAGDYRAYAGRFGAGPVVFEVGRSDPAQDWPFIQPGPADVWAPNAGGPWSIRFELPEPPRGQWTLRIAFVDVHRALPPRYAVAVGDRQGLFTLQPGGGDGSLTDPRLGQPQAIETTLPAGFFRQGPNEIRLACVEGSWVQYDAIGLWNDPDADVPPPEIRQLTARAAPFFIRQEGEVRRALDVSLDLTSPAAEATVLVEAGDWRREARLEQGSSAFGTLSGEVGVPDRPEPFEVRVAARVGDRTATATVQVPPQRRWRVFVAPSAHTDIGYTDLQPNCAQRHCQNTDAALALMREFPDFCWNLEVAWQAEVYLAEHAGPRAEDFVRFAREGRLGVQALYCNILTGLCSTEEACRLTGCAYSLCRRLGIPYRSAMISDVPTQEATLPMILAGSGIRYFSSGINNDRAYPFTQVQGRSPCWWEGPDGSRVLMMYLFGYAHAAGWGLDTGIEAARTRMMAALAGYEQRPDYPYDAVFLHGAVSDNCPLNPRLAEVARQWNERYEFPKVILCHNAEFFEYIEKQYGDRLPVVRGSAGTYWEDGAASSARETALCRNAHEAVAAGEALLALADRLGEARCYDRDAIGSVWRNCLLYDEHTWGAHCSVSQPESDFTAAQWRIKAQFAEDAAAGARQVRDQGMRALAGLVRTPGPAVVVLNTLSWPRTDLVRVELPEGLAVAEEGAAPFLHPDGGLFVLARDVPPCGYRVLRLAPGTGEPARFAAAEGAVIESRFYRVEFDPATGGIVSLRDKALDRELVDPQASFRLNQYVYAAGGEGTRIVSNPAGPEPSLTVTGSGPASLRRLVCPGVGQMMVVETSGPMAPAIRSTVSVWEELPRVDFVNHLTKTRTYAKEAVYFAFPFAASEPTIRYGVPAGIVNANTDMLPGACLDWFTVQHVVELEARDAAIAWATPDAPLVCFQDINRGRWQTRLPMVNGHLYAYVMNNYWHTNYRAGQGGEMTFRFAAASRRAADSPGAVRFGWGVSSPMGAVCVPEAVPAAPLAEPAASLVSVDAENVLVAGIKLGEDGRGLVVRLWETGGAPTTAQLRFHPRLAVSRAQACNLVEEEQGPLSAVEGMVTVPIRARGLATVRAE